MMLFGTVMIQCQKIVSLCARPAQHHPQHEALNRAAGKWADARVQLWQDGDKYLSHTAASTPLRRLGRLRGNSRRNPSLDREQTTKSERQRKRGETRHCTKGGKGGLPALSAKLASRGA
eukprot:358984-Chlamydomonas_euryale.AAC.7